MANLTPVQLSPSNDEQSNSVQFALTKFIERWLQAHTNDQNSDALTIEYDPDWPSPCYQLPTSNEAQPESGTAIAWQPVKQDTQDMFERLATALNIEIHPDIISFYSTFWSDHLSAATSDGQLTLLQVWNQADMERLRANLIGHAIAQQKQKMDISFFFALTSPDDGMLCINNKTAQVWYEHPGKKPIRKIANSLSEFIDSLTPVS
ncbi:SecY-interacting protein [Gammaproteobacteria bacterium AS21]